MKLTFNLAICATFVALLDMPALAQSPRQNSTDIPIYELSTHKASQAPSIEISTVDGALSVKHFPSSFHHMGLKFKDPSKKLAFRVHCYYTTENASGGVEAGPFEKGEICPTGGAARSGSISAIRLALIGTNTKNYKLNYECTESGGATFKRKANEYCGTPSFQNGRWLSELKIFVTSGAKQK